MAISTAAVYEDGVLKPLRALPLQKQQLVQIVVIPDVESVSDDIRLARMQQAAERWLAQQPPDAVREPVCLSPEEKLKLDAEFDQLLAEIRQHSEGISEQEIMADVREALEAVRGGNG